MPAPIFKQNYVDWNADALLDAAGGAAELRGLLSKYKFPLPLPETVYMWRSRGRVPQRWIPTILYVLLREKRITLATALVIRASGPGDAEPEPEQEQGPA
jgi:hypothetical protein